MQSIQKGTKWPKLRPLKYFLSSKSGWFLNASILRESVTTHLPSRGALQMVLPHSAHMRTTQQTRPHRLMQTQKTPWKSPSLVSRGRRAFPNAASSVSPPTWEGYRFLASKRSSRIHCVGDVYFSPYWCLSMDTFYKPRTPTDGAKMSHRSRRETDRERVHVSEGHWQGNLTVPAPPPPMPRH